MFEDLTLRDIGVTGHLPLSPMQYCITSSSAAITWAYSIELTLVIFYVFRRHTGLYFWSLLISSWGCTFHALGFVLKFLTQSPSKVYLPFIELGWVAMVTGQSVVLYSRLHLVVRSRRVLRLVLAMIIWNAITLQIPTIVLTAGSNGPNGLFWEPKFTIMEEIQLAMFCVQECIISTIYIVYTVRLLGSIFHSKQRTVMVQLIVINSVCLSMDLILIGLEFSKDYVGETSLKSLIYAIKLKLEFEVLNQLKGLTRAGFTEGNRWAGAGADQWNDMGNRGLVLEEIPSHPQPPPARRRRSTWVTAQRAASEARRKVFTWPFSKQSPRGQPWEAGRTTPPDKYQIYHTQRVDVMSEQKKRPQVRDAYPVP